MKGSSLLGVNHFHEFQVVILAGGYGNRLYPLTEDSCKALLPIGNRPMITHILEWLESAYISEAILVAPAEHEQKMRSFLVDEYFGSVTIDPVFLDHYVGTADALRAIKDKVKRDFLVVSSDTILNASLHKIAELHRVHDASMTALLFHTVPLDIHSSTDASKRKPEAMTVVGMYGEQIPRIVFLKSRTDQDSLLKFNIQLLSQFPRIHLRADLQDGHIYFFKRWIIDLIVEKKTLYSIQADLVPYLVSRQFRVHRTASTKTDDELLVSELMEGVDQTMQDAHALSSQRLYDSQDRLRCCAYVLDPGTDSFCLRANTLPHYMLANRIIVSNALNPIHLVSGKSFSRGENRSKISTSSTSSHLAQLSVATPSGAIVHVNAEVSNKAQVGGDSMVGEGSKVNENVLLRKSNLGKHCHIGKNAKIINSVIMDYVTIGDNVKVENSIISNNAVIETNCNLKDCIVGSFFKLSKGTHGLKEHFMVDRGMMDDDLEKDESDKEFTSS